MTITLTNLPPDLRYLTPDTVTADCGFVLLPVSTRDKHAVVRYFAVSDGDAPWVAEHSWSVQGCGLGRKEGRETVYLHVEIAKWNAAIFGPFTGLKVDHINGHRFDNRREFLRYLTPGENKRNSTVYTHDGRPPQSPFQGVSERSGGRGNRWRGVVSVGGRNRYTTTFQTALQAALARWTIIQRAGLASIYTREAGVVAQYL